MAPILGTTEFLWTSANFPHLTPVQTKADISENAWAVIEASDDKHVEAYVKLVVAIQHLLVPGTETSPTESTTPTKTPGYVNISNRANESALQWLKIGYLWILMTTGVSSLIVTISSRISRLRFLSQITKFALSRLSGPA